MTPVLNAIQVRWNGAGRKAQNPPNPAYPEGIDVVIAEPLQQSCKVALPYPAPECGQHIVNCSACGMSVYVTAAGRPDDPRSVTLACLRGRADA